MKDFGEELQMPIEVRENLAAKVSSVYYHAVAVTPQQLLVNSFMYGKEKILLEIQLSKQGQYFHGTCLLFCLMLTHY